MKRTISNPIGWLDSPWFIMCVFFALIAPFSLNFHFHYPDEMYYTDASIQMLKNRDYFTTYLGNGELRFKKPILTYWTVLAGFQIFGISPFSSRIFFLLFGTSLVGLTYLIAKTASSNKKIASTAAWIVASQPLVIFSSSRAIPDILLVCFLSLSAVGIVGLLKNPSTTSKRHLWLLYLGLGMAFAVKGLPAFALGAVAILYLAINPWSRVSVKQLLYPPALVSAIVIGLFWFIAMYVQFGPTYLYSFFDDQVGIRVGSKIGQVSRHLLYGLGVLIALFTPWIFFFRRQHLPSMRETLEKNAAFLGFAISWTVAILLMTGLVSTFYDRYLLPVYPVSVVAFAWLVLRDTNTSRITLRFLVSLFVAINFLVLTVGLYMNLGMQSPPHLILQWAIGLVLTSAVVTVLVRRQVDMPYLGISMMLLFFNGSLVSYPLSIPDQGTQVDEFVDQKGIPHNTQIGFIGNPHHSSKIRIGLDLDHELINLDRENPNWEDYDYLLCDETAIAQLPLDDVKIEVAAQNWDPKFILAIWESILEGDTAARRHELTKKYYLVTP
ncbi:MAG: phospholipid carrier-dependent glycosyltransferase [Lunatimonas sp.]|uniref:ArnT family glycosyltransferase n=1 Tax=Lunatimonas sp. TaxID=2060141 RepID=UPI00263B3ECA|nr:phospholipid carrier-dependent glycosyltransferase [Lunatimonas sp.]MCC5939804.1 phospholipid carrier-dependent glycosyltransferase [Lunatimonas sp.]